MKVHTLGVLVLVGGLCLTGCGPKAVPDASSVDEPATPATDTATGLELGTADGAEEESNEETLPASEAATQTLSVPSLGEKLAALSAEGKKTMPPEMMQIFANGIEEVSATGIVDAALNVGVNAIDGELPDATGNQVRLSELWAKGPLVVVWYRGGWCPYCNLQLQAMQEALPAIREAGATLVAITPETPDNSLSTSEKAGLEFVVLSDAGNALARQYGIVFKLPSKVSPLYKQMIDLAKYNGDDSDELPLAATYVIDSSGVIRYAFLDADYTKRAEPADVVAALRSL